MIVHILPGRIRLRHGGPLSTDQLDALGRRIRAIAPSATLTQTGKTASILVEFAERERTGAVVALLEPRARVRSTGPAGPGRSRFGWPSMTVVKRGMIGSLLGSLGLVALRREGGHALAGGVFLLFLSRHLWVYRKRLVK